MELREAYPKAIEISKSIISGDLDPYEGAMKVWKEILDYLEERIPEDLWSFKSNASAIEDIIWNFENGGEENKKLIKSCKMEVVEASKYLIEKYNQSVFTTP